MIHLISQSLLLRETKSSFPHLLFKTRDKLAGEGYLLKPGSLDRRKKGQASKQSCIYKFNSQTECRNYDLRTSKPQPINCVKSDRKKM